MKKIILSSLLVLGVLSSNSAFAQGLHITGTVTATATYISGAMNNRFNTTATTSNTYIYANGYALVIFVKLFIKA